MKYENVTFVDDAVRGMSKAKFTKAFIKVFWQDRDEETRKKMLADVWRRINGKDSDEE